MCKYSQDNGIAIFELEIFLKIPESTDPSGEEDFRWNGFVKEI